MDFIIENIYWLVFAAAGLVQWWKSTQEAKEERRRSEREIDPADLEEMIEQAERCHPRPAVPPPLPQATSVPAPPPVLERRTTPPPVVIPPLKDGVSTELERQAKLAEQMKRLQLEKRQRSREANAIATAGRKKQSQPVGSLRGRLQNRRELRQAFVLKEILEKPVGLR